MGVFEFGRNFIYGLMDQSLWKVIGIEGAFSLQIDGNGLLYAVANDVYGLGDKLDGTKHDKRKESEINAIKEKFKTNPAELEGQFLTLLCELLHQIIMININPTDVLIIALDGIPPPAKAYQQRSRRFASALDRLNASLLAQFGSKNTQEYIFNTINFTVGTPIMKKVCETIDTWLMDNKADLPRYVKFSDCSEEGEGEHKMFRYFHELENQMNIEFSDEDYSKTPSQIFRKCPHVVLSKDSDICFLAAMRTDYPFLWVRDEVYGFGNRTKRKDHDSPLEAISITAVKRFIVESMGGVFEKGTDIRGYIVDFTLLSYLIGDDFVPPMPTLTLHTGKTLARFMETYKSFYTGRRLAPDGKINIKTFSSFIDLLGPVERELYNMKKETQEIEFDYISKNENNEDTTQALKMRNNMRKYLGRMYNSEFEPSELLLLEYEHFVEKWGDCIVCPSLVTDIQFTGRGERYRQIALSAKDDEIPEVCYNYITGLQWNLSYYLGYNTNNWTYEWSFSPTIEHLRLFLKANPDIELPSVIMSDFDYKLDLGKLLFSIINPNLSPDIFGSLLRTKSGKVSMKTIQNKVTKTVKFYDVYCPVKFHRFFQGQYFNPNHSKHSAIALIPRIPVAIMFKLNDETRLKKDNISGGEIIPYGAPVQFDVNENSKSIIRKLLHGGVMFGQNTVKGIPNNDEINTTINFVGGAEVAKLRKTSKKGKESKMDRRNRTKKDKSQFGGKIMISQRREIRSKDII